MRWNFPYHPWWCCPLFRADHQRFDGWVWTMNFSPEYFQPKNLRCPLEFPLDDTWDVSHYSIRDSDLCSCIWSTDGLISVTHTLWCWTLTWGCSCSTIHILNPLMGGVVVGANKGEALSPIERSGWLFLAWSHPIFHCIIFYYYSFNYLCLILNFIIKLFSFNVFDKRSWHKYFILGIIWFVRIVYEVVLYIIVVEREVCTTRPGLG